MKAQNGIPSFPYIDISSAFRCNAGVLLNDSYSLDLCRILKMKHYGFLTMEYFSNIPEIEVRPPPIETGL